MKTLLAALCLAAFAVACGGTDLDASIDQDDVAKVSESEPATWVPMARKAAQRYAKDASLVHLEGQIGPADGFDWSFTFTDYSTGMWATVACDGKKAKVTEHHKLVTRMGQATIDLAKVRVTVEKLMKISAKAGLRGRVGSIQLDQALTRDMHPHWSLQQGGKDLAVDAYTGKVLR
jgi:hypothetical protein